MSLKRKHELVEVNPSLEAPLPRIDWTECLLCQIRTTQPLIQPKYEGYLSLYNDLVLFADCGSLPKCIRSLTRLDEGDGVLQTLMRLNAKYHKICRNRYDKFKAQRMVASKSTNQADDVATSLAVTNTRPTRSSIPLKNLKQLCIFCDFGEENGHLICASTLGIGPSIYENAVLLQDQILLTKLSSTDMVALEAKYHKSCYTRFFTKARSIQRGKDKQELNTETQKKIVYGSVVTELVDYIKDMYMCNEQSPVFKLSFFVKVTARRMTEMGVETSEIEINRTRLKDHLVAFVPGLRADKSGRDILLSFEEDVGDAIRDSCFLGDFTDGLCLARAAAIVRKTLFDDFPRFKGSLNDDFTPLKSVPPVLLHFIKMLLEGSNIDNEPQKDESCEQAALSISQLIRFNSIKNERKATDKKIRHLLRNETPLPLYIGLMIHNVTKKKKILDKLFKLGVCVSYDRIQEISASITNEQCIKYNQEGLVCPPAASANVFVTAAIDNIDHNQSSANTVNNFFHGSSVTVIQHPKIDAHDQNQKFRHINIERWSRAVNNNLPLSYTNVPPLGRVVKDPLLRTVNTTCFNNSSFDLDMWLKRSSEVVMSDRNEEQMERVSFAAFNSKLESREVIKSHSTLLPLFSEEIASPSMIKHLMDVVISITLKLNRDQTPVITGDQPVYAIAKQIQWRFPNSHGENKVLVMMGGLHIEMMIINLLGKWLLKSGWTETLANAGVASVGVAETCLTSSHVKRARYAHEVTIVALNILQEEAYKKYCEGLPEQYKEEKAEWKKRMIAESAQFNYWNTVIQMESLLLQFIFSIRTANFKLFVATLKNICPWTFALDAVHYSRWLPIFVRDLEELPDRHPALYEEFLHGNFTSNRTTAAFSSISDDQFHEQNNKMIKCDGGAKGIFDNETALLKWMVAGPDISRIITEFENVCDLHSVGRLEKLHHEDTRAFEGKFRVHIKSMVDILNEEGNPFESDRLISIGSKKLIAQKESVRMVEKAHSVGLKQYEEYVESRLNKTEHSIHDIIKKNNILIFNLPIKVTSKTKTKIANLRHDSSLFCKLYVASQNRQTDVSNFFAHENQPFPPSISEGGRLRKPNSKSDIIQCLENSIDKDILETGADNKTSAAVLDGAVIVHLLIPRNVKTFLEYYTNIFKPYILRLLQNLQRIDLVFDRYSSDSLKADTRQSRGIGEHIRVTPSTIIPKKYNEFLRVDENKQQLFSFLAKQLTSETFIGKTIVCTLEESVISSSAEMDLSDILPSWHEEADGRLLLHAKHAVDNGHNCVTIRTVDSDVVVIAVSTFFKIKNIQQLWIDFGTGKHQRLISIHGLCSQLSQETCRYLPIFHSITGCDTVSSFCGVGKKGAWKVWIADPNVNSAFEQLLMGRDPDEDILRAMERFVVLLYDATSPLSTVNECRRFLFIKKIGQLRIYLQRKML